jgi:hypothetical protein
VVQIISRKYYRRKFRLYNTYKIKEIRHGIPIRENSLNRRKAKGTNRTYLESVDSALLLKP